jgi:hypothetical protein
MMAKLLPQLGLFAIFQYIALQVSCSYSYFMLMVISMFVFVLLRYTSSALLLLPSWLQMHHVRFSAVDPNFSLALRHLSNLTLFSLTLPLTHTPTYSPHLFSHPPLPLLYLFSTPSLPLLYRTADPQVARRGVVHAI